VKEEKDAVSYRQPNYFLGVQMYSKHVMRKA